MARVAMSAARRRAATDGELARALTEQDEGALEELYGRHGGPCFALARRVLADRSLAEEIVQEVFVRLWRQVASLEAHRERRSRGARAGAIVAAAAAIVAIVLAVQVVSLHRRLDDATTSGDKALAIAFDHAQSAPGAKEAALSPTGGAAVARVVLLPDGSGYLRNDAMKPLAPDQTYQLWALTGDAQKPTVISAGVLGADPKAAAFRTAGPVHGFVVTVEHAPGVVSSTQPPYAAATLS